MNRRVIEHDLPLAEISEASAREKNIRHGHPSTLHIWWARRPLAASRATTLAALLEDPVQEEDLDADGNPPPELEAKREDIKDLIRRIVPWEAVKNGNDENIKRAQQLVREQYTDDDGTFDPPKVLDPFAGGGSIPLEALRLGCETYASDYNPVAVFIEKATLEWPQKFGVEVELPESEDNDGLGMGGKKVNLLAYLVEKWANKILESAREEIGQFYPTETGEGLVGKREVDPDQDGWTPVGYLWARTIPCQNPTCGATIPLIKQFWLCKKDDKQIAYRPDVDREAETVTFERLHGDDLQRAMDAGFDPGEGTVHRANASCPVCEQVTEAEQVRELARDGQMGERMVAVVFHHPDETGKKYRLATEDDVETYEAAAEHLQQTLDEWPHLERPLPTESISTYELRRVALPLYGVEEWRDIFNERQSLALVTFLSRVRNREPIEKDCREVIDRLGIDKNPSGFADAILGYLGILLSRTADYNTRLSGWENTREGIDHLFGRQAIPMKWDYCETNVFSRSTGDWLAHWRWIDHFIQKNSWQSQADATAFHADATAHPSEDESLDVVVSDPPYYDNVPYAALSDFFYVWLKRACGENFSELFSTPLVPKSEEVVHDRPHSFSESEKTPEYFEAKLGESFQEMHRVLKPGGVAVIVYAHKTTEGWETMLSGLVEAGFVVTGSWPVHTEMKNRLVAAQTAALASSIYMVCRKAEREPLGFWNEVKPRVKQRVEEKLEQFWEADVIRGGDFFISAIGPGMEAYSRYDRVETVGGEEVTVADLLQTIRKIATDFLVSELLKNGTGGAIDENAQFYLTYRWTFRDTRVEYDDARRIAAAEGVSLDALADRDSFVKKTRKYVYVHGPQERDPVTSVHDMVDALHLACQTWAAGDQDEVGPLLARAGYHQSPAFWQFCQAVSECLPDGAKEKQLLQGMLMSKSDYQQAEAGEAGLDEGGQMEIDFDE
jgi:adenine-specific DNA methylase